MTGRIESSLTTSIQAGKGLVKVNGKPLGLLQPEILRFKVRTHSLRKKSTVPRLS